MSWGDNKIIWKKEKVAEIDDFYNKNDRIK